MKNLQYSTSFLLFLVFTILATFIILQPKLSPWLFSLKRSVSLNIFIADINQNKTIQPRKFWEFREFYYPGFITMNKEGLSKNNIDEKLQKLGIKITPSPRTLSFLTYTSDKINSVESLVPTQNIFDSISNVELKNKEMIIHNKNEIAYYNQDRSITMIFIKPTAEMVLANGYFDYRNKKDVQIYEGRWWLVVTKIDTK